MPDPATIGMAVKAAVSVVTDEKTRNRIGWIIAAILSPFLVILILIFALLSGGAAHNNSAIELCFSGGAVPPSAPNEYRQQITQMQASFGWLDAAIAELQAQMDVGACIDTVRVKAVFYVLYFGRPQPSAVAHTRFVECFVTWESRTDPETGDSTMVPVPIREAPTIFTSLTSTLSLDITPETKANATEIYYRILYGAPAPTYGSEFDSWLDGLPFSDAPFLGAGGFCSPIGAHWRDVVTSEFGFRIDPITGQGAGHTGIDLGMPKGTPIHAALSGTVYFVRYASSGYGYHVMIDHGGGFVTLYAHCSRILVVEGQTVSVGDVIAEVGSTGRSTGNHLHFEVRANGTKLNPRYYLP